MSRKVEDSLGEPIADRPEPVGPRQCQELAAVVAGLMPGWSVELHQDVLGEPIVVIVPQNLDDAIGPTLIVYGDKEAFHLEELRWDTARKLGDYRAWDEVLRGVRISLIWEMPFPRTLH